MLAAGTSCAAMEMPAIFSNGMILQRETGAPIWGWTDAGTKVSVEFAGQKLETKADADGKWRVDFKNLKATKTGSNLAITAGAEQRVITDVLVGEVWIASGQSNMEWSVNGTNDKDEAAKVVDPALRVFMSRNVAVAEPLRDFPGKWAETKPGNTLNFTAVGYQFAKKLREELDVPVGVIECAWGGKPVESFISAEAMAGLAEGKELLAQRNQAIAAYKPEEIKAKLEADFQQKLAAWEKNKQGEKPKLASMPGDPRTNSNLTANIFNGMINPIAGYGARGAIWYQGESNANGNTAKNYAELQAAMVMDWRERWGSELSFYYVQLANFRKPSEQPGAVSDWVVVQDEQRQMLKSVEKTGMAVINDIGEANNIHPKNKKDVGQRLARWALNRDYGKSEVVPSGPLFSGLEFKNGKAIVSFDFSKGLKTRDGQPLKRVEIAGEDGKWVWANAEIKGEQLIAWSDEVKKPKKLRYAWAENPTGATLVNAEGLPASVFTSEN